MTTSQHLDRDGLQDWYSRREECEASVKGSYARSPTNPRYKNFKQGIFTAGDEEQFEEFRDPTTHMVEDKTVTVSRVVVLPKLWEGFRDIRSQTVTDTFRYIFHKLKKGLFVKIVDNKLKVFLPFSKDAYVNEWGTRINSESDHVFSIFRRVAELDGRRFFPKGINPNPRLWYGNNGLVRYESPMAENDTNLSTLRDMLNTLCAEREVPDVEFFINRRDFPLKKRTPTEPYDNIWDCQDQELVSHRYDKYAPIMSMSSSDEYADILIPTFEDWARVEQPRGKWFSYCCRDLDVDKLTLSWCDKKPTAIFRGGSTGIGVTVETNMRLKAAALTVSAENLHPDDGIQFPYLDAGITNWNVRPRKLKGDSDLHVIDYRELSFSLSPKMTMQEQSEFKYLLHIQGHVSAFRLSYELGMGCVILLVESQWNLWFSHLLVPDVHFVPVKSDLSDLFDKIKWCRQHDTECEKIANNAKLFYKEHLCRDGVLDCLQNILVETKRHSGHYFYPVRSLIEYQLRVEKSLSGNSPPLDAAMIPPTAGVFSVPKVPRCHSTLEALGWSLSKDIQDNCLKCGVEQQIAENKLGIVWRTLYAGMLIARKHTSNNNKMREHAHEIFVGLKGVNRVIKNVPNFAYTFGGAISDSSVSVYTEFITGDTFDEYLRSPRCRMVNVLGILMQVSLALEVAQNTCGFVHMDLMPWNILLQDLKDGCARVPYLLQDTIITARSSLVPVIIDFGKSHIIHEGRYHGFVRLYQPSRVQDVVTLLVQTLNILKDVRLTHVEFPILLQIASFLAINPDTMAPTGNSYCPNRFNTAKDLRRWISEHKSYGNLTLPDKDVLERLSPRDFFDYLSPIFERLRGDCSVGTSFDKNHCNYVSCMDRGNSLQTYHYIRSGTRDERYASYWLWFKRMCTCELPTPNNLLFVYYACQSLWLSVHSTYQAAVKTKYADEKLECLYNDVLDRIDAHYQPVLDQDPTPISCEIDALIDVGYSDGIFSYPEQIETMLRETGSTNLAHHQVTLRQIFSCEGPYSLPEDVKKFYVKNLDSLMTTPTHRLLNDWARNGTLQAVASEVYSDIVERIDDRLTDPSLPEFKCALTYRNACLKVLATERKLRKKENISVH